MRVVALAHAVPHGFAAVEAADQMHIEHLGKIRRLQLAERLVAQDAGVGAEQIDTAPLLGRALHHRLDLLEIGNVGAVGHRRAASFADFLDHGFRRRQRSASAVARAAEIIDHDLGAAARQPQRMRAPETIARAGDDGDASVKPDFHELCSRIAALVMPVLDPGIHPKRPAFLSSEGLPGQARQ